MMWESLGLLQEVEVMESLRGSDRVLTLHQAQVSLTLSVARLENRHGAALYHRMEWNKSIKLCKFLSLRSSNILLPYALLCCS